MAPKERIITILMGTGEGIATGKMVQFFHI
jgi:hypothetical protein